MSDEEKPFLEEKEQGVTLPRSRVRALIKQCQRSSETYVDRVFELLAKQVRNDLTKLMETTHEFTKAQRYSEAMRQLRSEHDNLARQFHLSYSRLLNQALNQRDRHGDSIEDLDDALTLVEESQLEESLVVEQITSKIFEHCSDELYALEQRLSCLLPEHDMEEGRVPFGSATICSAFEEILQPLELDIKVKLAIYRSLERSLLESIGSLYDELNDILAQAGVMPEIKRKVKKSPAPEYVNHPSTVRAAQQGSAQDGSSNHTHAAAPGSVTQQPQAYTAPVEGVANSVSEGAGTGITAGEMPLPHAFQGIQQLAGLFTGEAVAGTVPQAALVSTPITPQLIEALSGLQATNELFESGIEMSGEALKAHIKTELSGREGGSSDGISQLDDETIDVINMIFDDLMGDEHLPDNVKALLGRLQIPVLKVAIIDRVFFSQKEHPARVLLNQLTIAGQTVNAVVEGEKSSDLVYKKIESIVMCLMHEFQGDVELFETCLADLTAFMDEHNAGFHQVHQEIGKRAEKNSRAAKAHKNTAEIIAGKLLHRKVPEEIKAFLMGRWREVLSTIIDKEGCDSEAFQRAEQMIGDLVWSMDPPKTASGKKKLLAVIPVIIDEVREGLAMIGYTEAQMQGVIQEIERYHIANISTATLSSQPLAEAVLKPQPVDEIDCLLRDLADELDLPVDELTKNEELSLSPSENNDSGEFKKMMEAMGIVQEEEHGPRIDDRFTVQVAALEVGAWVELQDEKGERRRTKLAWKGDEFTHYAFVNWRYQVVAEKSYYGLAEEFRQGNARVIEELPLFDRAFDSVFTKIMQLAS